MKNKFTATVQEIESAQGSTLVTFRFGDVALRSITLDPPVGLAEGSEATLIIHETRPILSNNPLEGIANTLLGHIESIEEGEMLTRINVKTAGASLSVLTDTLTFNESSWIIDQKVYLSFKATDIAIEVNT
ncbi:MAG: hypothetical protein IE884_00780 [Sulfuricurvum sp.]|nr:hypothetical protein [Sulfuricurvum sp.]